MEYYVYRHLRLKDNSIFYIGKGKGDRYNCENGRNNHWNNIVKKDGGFIAEIIKDNLTNDDACKLEIDLINEIGLNNLSNIATGGQGGDTRKGFTDEEMLLWDMRRRASLKGRTSPMKGKIREEHSTTLKQLHKNGTYTYEWLKNPKTTEHKQKLSESALNRIRKEVKCPKCGRMILDTHLKPHMRGTKCITNN
jgi:hypothetical protein